MKRRTFLTIGLGLLLGGGAAVTQQVLKDDLDTRYELFQLVNKRRAARGLPHLKTSAALMKRATAHAKYMATHQELVHSHLQLPPGGDWVGEIIGVGGDFESVMRAWLQSPEHRKILLFPRARFAGAGAVFAQRWWLVVQFSH